jgi:hypothetical protein
MYDFTGAVGLIKTKAIILTRLLAVLAAGFLVIPLCADCKDRCSRLQGTSCHIEKQQEKSDSACCHHTKPQPKNNSPEKCKSTCCINSLPLTATSENQNISLNKQITSVICESNAFIESGIMFKIIKSSSAPPFYLHNRTQSILCVFVI